MTARTALFCYSLFAAPLALAALPVYVYAPALYATREAIPLGMMGALLLGARLLDAFIDPALGVLVDRSRRHAYRAPILVALPLLALGFLVLFNPPALSEFAALAWLTLALLLVQSGYSLAGIAYQSWGAALTHERGARTAVTGSREFCGLVGVVAAAILPSSVGLAGTSAIFVAVLAGAAWLLLVHGARPPAPSIAASEGHGPLSAIGNREFRRLLMVFLCNGIASAIPATLFPFFAADRLHLGARAGYFLAGYFLAGAASMPFWIWLARRTGEARAWLCSMALAVAAFSWAYTLDAHSQAAFGAICALSGLALGADLALPPALLGGVIHRAGHSGLREGAYFGVWNWAAKMNLALAAGAALPLLAWLGYRPGAESESAIQALTLAYAVLPCVFKLAAAALLSCSTLEDV